MTTSNHIETALDQLRLADDIATTHDQQVQLWLAAAQVHATLALVSAIRDMAAERVA